MGSVCSACTVFDEVNVRDRNHNTEAQHRLINYPDPTTPVDNDTHIQKKSSVADRLAKFESNAKKTNNKKFKTKTKTINKPSKKWTVKGIDDKPTNQYKKPINAASKIPKNIVNNNEEPSVSLSHKDRMQIYKKDVDNVQQKEKDRIQQHKDARGGYAGIQVSSEQKEMAKKLLEQRIDKQQKGDIGGMTDNIILKSDSANHSSVGQSVTKKKKRSMNELLKDATSEDGRNIISGMGMIVSEYNHKEKRDVCVLNMNNNTILNRLTEEQKMKFIFLIGHSIVDRSGDSIERVTMCNACVSDKLMIELMRILVENKGRIVLSELWLESNRIGDDGMTGLCLLIECNLESLRVIKLYNNKKDVSTGMCNKMIDALEKNDKIIKFTFEFRLQQQKDRVARLLKRNQELRRKARRNK